MPAHPSSLPVRFAALAAILAAAATLAVPRGVAQEAPARTGRVLPRFAGTLVDGGRAGTELLQGRRGVLFVFSTEDPEVDRIAEIIARLAPEARRANVKLLGVSRDPIPLRVRAFARRHGLEFPILHDADGLISRKLQLPPQRAGVIVVDAEGYLIYGWAGLDDDPERMAAYRERELRSVLYLEEDADSVLPQLGLAPEAPPFEVRSLDGEVVTLGSLAGNVVVLVFFLPTCPHCHDTLKFLDGLARQLAAAELSIVPVSTSNRRYVIEDMAEELGLDLVMYTDPGGTAQRDYAHRLSVPDTLVIDRLGRVVLRLSGSGNRTEALLTMQIKHELGVPNPMILFAAGYSGGEFCNVCHASQHATWSLTNHAGAFQSLVEHGEDRNSECLPCHTVGWDQPGGFAPDRRFAYLEGVQCENCHGRGGPHQSPDFAKSGFESACATCHTPEHSLRFNFAERLPLVSHAANTRFASLSLDERRKLLEQRDVRARTLFESAPYVGSATCQSCHQKEHELWSKSAHASAVRTLEIRDEAQNETCQRCHTTGFGESTGWPGGGDALRDVGCESCHGPGGRHVVDGSRGTILRLTEKCESCVILQICGSCHDQANDPDFEFELMDKLER
ncbi:MAG: redoxin domain-containing protein, partial [Myxococcota bacterium]